MGLSEITIIIFLEIWLLISLEYPALDRISVSIGISLGEEMRA